MMVRFTKKHYKGVDKSKIIKQAYKLMIENDGYDLDIIIEILMEKSLKEEECSEVLEEYSLKSTVDPAFAGLGRM